MWHGARKVPVHFWETSDHCHITTVGVPTGGIKHIDSLLTCFYMCNNLRIIDDKL